MINIGLLFLISYKNNEHRQVERKESSFYCAVALPTKRKTSFWNRLAGRIVHHRCGGYEPLLLFYEDSKAAFLSCFTMLCYFLSTSNSKDITAGHRLANPVPSESSVFLSPYELHRMG